MEERPTAAQVNVWFVGDRYSGIGLVCGKVSGDLEMLELEGRAIKAGLDVALFDAAEAAGLGEVLDRIANGYQEYTPSGGLHWLYRCEGATSTKIANTPDEDGRPLTLIETKGEGGFTIIAPSNGTTHPTGGSWELALGSLETIATITPEERAELLRLCALFDEMGDDGDTSDEQDGQRTPSIKERLKRGEGTGSPSAPGSRPGDEYNERTTWAELLEPAGWVALYGHKGATMWRRPGKDRGGSATTNHTGTDRLKVFSTSTPFSTEGTYSKFAAYATLEHNGNFAGAARALARDGFGAPPAPNSVRATGQSIVASDGALADGHRGTEVANADRFVAATAGRARYVHAWGRWIVYDDLAGVWRIDTGDALVTEMAKTVARTMFAASLEHSGESRDGLWKWAKRSEAAAAISAMIRLARGMPGILVDHHHLDNNPWLLNVANGTIDLQTGALRPHDPDDLITLQAPTRYQPDAPTPLWDACLQRWQPDPEMRTYLQRVIGTGATGVPIEHLFVNVGPGGNGKGKFYGAIAHVLGDYVVVPHKSLLTVVKHEQHDTIKARLFGARLAIASETDTGDRIDEAKVKEITGGDLLEARRMREDPWKFAPSHTMVMHTNHRPRVRGTDEGVWRRLRLIRWDTKIPIGEQDDQLAAKLQVEASGILNWVVAGALDWHAHGLQEPDAVITATAAYRADEDSLAAFIDEYCELHASYRASAPDLWSAYEEWCAQSGNEPVAKRTFATMLTERGYAATRDRRFRTGLRLIEDSDARNARISQMTLHAGAREEVTGNSAHCAHAESEQPESPSTPPPDDDDDPVWEI